MQNALVDRANIFGPACHKPPHSMLMHAACVGGLRSARRRLQQSLPPRPPMPTGGSTGGSTGMGVRPANAPAFAPMPPPLSPPGPDLCSAEPCSGTKLARIRACSIALLSEKMCTSGDTATRYAPRHGRISQRWAAKTFVCRALFDRKSLKSSKSLSAFNAAQFNIVLLIMQTKV
jgi:hypothetical protein